METLKLSVGFFVNVKNWLSLRVPNNRVIKWPLVLKISIQKIHKRSQQRLLSEATEFIAVIQHHHQVSGSGNSLWVSGKMFSSLALFDNGAG